MSQTTLKRYTWTSFSWRNGSNLSSKYSLNVLCPVGRYILTRTGPSTTIPQQWPLYFGYCIFHTGYRVNLLYLQIELFHLYLRKVVQTYFRYFREKRSYPCYNFFFGLLHRDEKKASPSLWGLRCQMSVLTLMVVYS